MIEAAERFQAIQNVHKNGSFVDKILPSNVPQNSSLGDKILPSNVTKNGSFGHKILPSNESQVRPLTELSDAEAVHVWVRWMLASGGVTAVTGRNFCLGYTQHFDI